MPTDPSPTDPFSLDCGEALERLYEFLDGELNEDVEKTIEQHLAACARCEPKFAHERVFLQFIAKRAHLEQAPPELRKRLLRELMDADRRRSAE